MNARPSRSTGPRARTAWWAFRLSLCLYPPAFRQRFECELAQTFRAALDDPARHLGLLGTLTDLVRSALYERMVEMPLRSLLTISAVILGISIAWVDSRPTWDDTGITAGMVFLCCVVFGALSPKQAWQWALAVGIWVPLYGVLVAHNFGTVLAFVPAFAGAYIGAAMRMLVFPPDAA